MSMSVVKLLTAATQPTYRLEFSLSRRKNRSSGFLSRILFLLPSVFLDAADSLHPLHCCIARVMVNRAIRNLLIFHKSNEGSRIFSPPHLVSHHRSMTTSKRVQDRSKMKRIHDLEIATEKWKIVSKVLFLMEILKEEPEQVISIRSLNQHRRQINLPKPQKISDFIKKSPKLFELYKDHKGVLWCGMTKDAKELVQEEERITEEYSEKAAEHVARCLMMSVAKRLPFDKIAHFRRDFGLPLDFRKDWVYSYPEHFRVVKNEDDIEGVFH